MCPVLFVVIRVLLVSNTSIIHTAVKVDVLVCHSEIQLSREIEISQGVLMYAGAHSKKQLVSSRSTGVWTSRRRRDDDKQESLRIRKWEHLVFNGIASNLIAAIRFSS
jgi:hypothetical protein